MTALEQPSERHLSLVRETQGGRVLHPVFQPILDEEPTTDTVIEVRINDQWHEATDLPQEFGFTYDQWRQQTELKEAARTFCNIAGVKISLEVFERTHNHIQLGQE